ncbi:MAG TPA: response regulator transcription factor [Gemmatimonadaceae bacterium]|jgi:DNA-binding NarL/FixJ family response regulator|nr:response regulator transcription factor [Gemmatimonadaceae bacterium]
MTGATASIRLLCVDDHRLVRKGIARIVETQPDMRVVAEASNGEEAIEQFKRHQPDVTLMDIELPRMSGLDAIGTIRDTEPDARIVVLTMYHGEEDVYRAVQAGAAAYLLKDAVPEDLIRVIRDVHAGARVFPPEIVATLEQRASQPGLTARERQVLELMAAGKRTKEIAATLGISSETASAYVKSIFTKFDLHGRSAVVAEAVRRGIVRLK